MPNFLVGVLSGLAAILLLAGNAVAAPAMGTLSSYRLLVLDGGTVKWGTPQLGSGTVVTYSLVETPRHFDGARNCANIAPIGGLLERSGVARSAFDVELASAFAAWSEVADIQFVAAHEASADILIGAQVEPRGRAFTNVATHPRTAGTIGSIARSLICLNPAQAWKIGFDGDLDVYDLRYTLMHEIGHAIGLDHPGINAVLMDFRYREAFASLQPGDRLGAVSLYGVRPLVYSDDDAADDTLALRANTENAAGGPTAFPIATAGLCVTNCEAASSPAP